MLKDVRRCHLLRQGTVELYIGVITGNRILQTFINTLRDKDIDKLEEVVYYNYLIRKESLGATRSRISTERSLLLSIVPGDGGGAVLIGPIKRHGGAAPLVLREVGNALSAPGRRTDIAEPGHHSLLDLRPSVRRAARGADCQ